jgi:GNAT superfamily N-acetyltransferase
MDYKENFHVSAMQIADLRHSVGWNRMQECYESELIISFFHIACYEGAELIAYIDTVSNGVTDAYIQDLLVHPGYQGRGIGTTLMNKTIEYLKTHKIYMISVLFDEKLLPFYRRFGFTPMLGGQLQTYDMA